jgi:tRNA 2-thiocytidine biosynthesis protein TtcA
MWWWLLATTTFSAVAAFNSTPLRFVRFVHKTSSCQLMANNDQLSPDALKLRFRLLKSLRQISLRYAMLEQEDKIMVCVSGGKDSATLLHLLLHMQTKLSSIGTNFQVFAVHLNQMQPGYDGTPLISWLESLGVEYRIVTEDTFSIVTDKTPENKAYCSLCSRLRRGILYSIAHELGCNKIALGHHGDDAVETLLLNMIHGELS